jgi:RimJ/RimL family protein N-acetyltransferase
VFSPSMDERKRTDEEWQTILHTPSTCVFGLYYNDELVGLTGLFKDRDDPSEETALCVMSYIRIEHRGKGLSRMLYENRIKAAKEMGYRRIKTAHRASNKPSERANQAFGFVLTERKSHVWPDGTCEDILEYELEL